MRRFNPPPNWPPPPPGFEPGASWKPDRAWGPPPPGWDLWIEDSEDSTSEDSTSEDVPGDGPAAEGPPGVRSGLLRRQVTRVRTSTETLLGHERTQRTVRKVVEVAKDERTTTIIKGVAAAAVAAAVSNQLKRRGVTMPPEVQEAIMRSGRRDVARRSAPVEHTSEPFEIEVSAQQSGQLWRHPERHDLWVEVTMLGFGSYAVAVDTSSSLFDRTFFDTGQVSAGWAVVEAANGEVLPIELRRVSEKAVACRWLLAPPAQPGLPVAQEPAAEAETPQEELRRRLDAIRSGPAPAPAAGRTEAPSGERAGADAARRMSNHLNDVHRTSTDVIRHLRA